MRSGNHDKGNRRNPGEIQVEHEIEMKSVPISEVMGHESGHGHGHGGNLNGGGSEEDIGNAGRMSPAGSERNLVWQQDDVPFYGTGQSQGVPGMGMGMGMGHGKKVTTITTCQGPVTNSGSNSRQEQQQAREREMV